MPHTKPKVRPGLFPGPELSLSQSTEDRIVINSMLEQTSPAQIYKFVWGRGLLAGARDCIVTGSSGFCVATRCDLRFRLGRDPAGARVYQR